MYKFEYNGFTAETISTPNNNKGMTITNTEGLSAFDIRTDEENKTADDGGIIYQQQYGMRLITVSGAMWDETLTDYYEERQQFLQAFSLQNTELPLVITRSDGQQVQIQARLYSMPDFREVEGEYAEATFQFSLKCPIGFFESTSEQSGILLPGVTGGFPVPMPVPAPIGRSVDTLILNNTGQIEVTPDVTLTGRMVNPVLTNQTTGESFRLDTTIAPGTQAIINKTQSGLEVSNNGLPAFEFFKGNLPKLVPGNNSFVLNANEFDSNAKATISFNPRQLTI